MPGRVQTVVDSRSYRQGRHFLLPFDLFRSEPLVTAVTLGR